MRFLKKCLMILLPLFYVINGDMALSQTKRNCDYKTASIYFANPTPILNKYSSEYFCSDIYYLEKTNLGNISLSQYQQMYGEASSNFNYLRSLGITPDIIDKHFSVDENAIKTLQTKNDIDNYIKAMIAIAQIGSDFTIIPASSFNISTSTFKNYNEQAGNILNQKGNNCIKDKRLPITSGSDLYTSKTPTYFEIIASMPVILRPIAIKGNNLINIFGDIVGTIDYNTSIGGPIISTGLDKSSIRKITFNNQAFSTSQSVNVNWNEDKCKTKTLSSEVAKSSVCFMCPYIVMIFNQISYLLNYMYESFRVIIISFLVYHLILILIIIIVI